MKKIKFALPVILTIALLAGCGGGSKGSSNVPTSSSDSSVDSSVTSSNTSSSESKPESSSNPASSYDSKSSSSASSKPSSSSQAPVKQDGTASYPWLISTKEDLLAYFGTENEKLTKLAHVALANDIDFNGEWTPSYLKNSFSGVLHGNGHTIKGLKITRGTTSIPYYGFIGTALDAHIEDLNLEMEFDLELSGKARDYVVGGAVALADNTTLRNVNVTYSNYKIGLFTNGGSSAYVGGLVGYFTASEIEGVNYVYHYDFANCAVKGNISVDSRESADTSVMTGGILGAQYGSYYNVSGLFTINNCKYEGNLLGGDATGGIVGVLMSYSSVVNSYVKANKIEAVNASPSYTGGIVGQATYFDAVVGCYADINFINGTTGTKTYNSFVGDIIGYKAPDIPEYEYEGTLDYNNYAKGATLDVAERFNVTENKANYSAALLKDTLKFNTNVWDLGSNGPTLKANPASNKVSINVDTNGGSGSFKTITANAGEIATETANLSYSYAERLEPRDNYSPKGLFYDKACNYKFRWYVPFNASATLYVGWADLTPIIGTYSINFQYYEVSRSAGQLVITNTYIYWLMTDGAYSQYEYTFDGGYIYLGLYVNPLMANDPLAKTFGQSFGGYSGTVIAINENGALEWLDSQSDDGLYTATKTGGVSEIPSLKGLPILGKWYTDTGKNTLDVTIVENNAIIVSYNDGGSAVNYYGGVKTSGNKYTMACGERGLTSDTYAYDDANKLLIGDKYIMARDKVLGVYATSDNKVRVVVTEKSTVVVKNNAVANVTVSGTFANGQKVTIDGVTYDISGKTLKVHEDISPIVGTYTGRATRDSNVLAVSLTFTNDGKGTGKIGETNVQFKWTHNTSTNKVTITLTNVGASDWDEDEPFVFTYIPVEQKLTGSMTQDFGSYTYNFEVAVGGLPEPEPEPEPDTGIVGTYTATMKAGFSSPFSVSLVVNADNTMVISWDVYSLTFSYTYNESTKKMTITLTDQVGTYGSYDDGPFTLTYNNGTLTGEITQDFGDVIYTITASK